MVLIFSSVDEVKASQQWLAPIIPLSIDCTMLFEVVIEK
jgi:hypothetical protein